MIDSERRLALCIAAALGFVTILVTPASAQSVRTVVVGEDASSADRPSFAPYAQPSPDSRTDAGPADELPDELPYTPGRLVLKLDADTGRRARSSASQSRATFGIEDLDRLNRRFGARSLGRPFAARSARVAARDTTNDRRAARAPAGAVSPSFDDVYVVELSRYLDMEEVAREYARVPGVLYAEPDREVGLFLTTNDAYLQSSGAWGQAFGDLWGMEKIDAESAWDTTRGAGVVVAVIDTGVDFAHPELTSRAWTNTGEIAGNDIDDNANGYVDDIVGWDVSSGDNDPFDDHGHGTHVAGTVAPAPSRSCSPCTRRSPSSRCARSCALRPTTSTWRASIRTPVTAASMQALRSPSTARWKCSSKAPATATSSRAIPSTSRAPPMGRTSSRIRWSTGREARVAKAGQRCGPTG